MGRVGGERGYAFRGSWSGLGLAARMPGLPIRELRRWKAGLLRAPWVTWAVGVAQQIQGLRTVSPSAYAEAVKKDAQLVSVGAGIRAFL